MKYILLLLITFFTISVISCKKCKTVNAIEIVDTTPAIDLKNRTLIGVPLDTLRKALAGTWLQKSRTVCGITGCFTTIYGIGQEDTYYFLPQDTVKRVKPNGVVNLYGKAEIFVSTYDSSWNYSFAGGTFGLSFYRINNDTLLLDPLCGGCGSISKLVKKP